MPSQNAFVNYQQQQSQQQMPQMPAHNPGLVDHGPVYDKLRGVVTHLLKQGTPGMDKVLKAINDAHVEHLGGQIPTLPTKMPNGGFRG